MLRASPSCVNRRVFNYNRTTGILLTSPQSILKAHLDDLVQTTASWL